ncbi:MAG: sigma-54-dependent Fis family transcriptional regulator [Sporomusaceae bacterium]|nr:sigma-54-dependent Fis family transcriptional regulator [Sporomusaceae bacterium]
MRIIDMMNTDIVPLNSSMSLAKAAKVFSTNLCYESLPVVNSESRVTGLLTKPALIKAIGDFGDALGHTISEVMTVNIVTLRPLMTLFELHQHHKHFEQVIYPVVDDNKRFLGIVNCSSLLYSLPDAVTALESEFDSENNALFHGVIAINGQGLITAVNRAGEQLIGLTKDQLEGRAIEEVLPQLGMLRVLQTSTAEMNQYFHVNGHELLLNRFPIFNEQRIDGAVATFQDITALDKLQKELRTVQQQNYMTNLFVDSMLECVVAVDRKGIIVMLNSAYCNLLGIRREDAVGKHVSDVIPNTRMHMVAHTGKAEVGEYQRIKSHHCIVTRLPVMQGGQVVGAVGKIMFTELKELKTLANKHIKMQSDMECYTEETSSKGHKLAVEQIVGKSEEMERLKMLAVKAARGNSTVLILGDSGTGKELFAQAIYHASSRRHGPFVKVNCAAVPENLLESELFGYEEGAFTGARKGGKPGKFELAQGGTIFLDEIGDMPLSMQAKLLRVLQEKEIERVGGTKSTKVDTRVIAATNCNLEEKMAKGEFRLDLFYRLNIVPIHIPPLSERREDIPLLCQVLLQKIYYHVQHEVEGVSPAAMELLMAYEWPGNVRELENVLERAVNMMDDERYIMPKHLPLLSPVTVSLPQKNQENNKKLAGLVGDTEKQAIYKALELAGGNKSKAAKLLGIHRSGFYQKLQKYKIH